MPLQAQNGTLTGSGGTLNRTCCCKGGNCIGVDCPHLCGSDNTCNKFCNSSVRSFSLAEQCDCPCSERRDFPVYYDVRWEGVTLKSGPLATGDATYPTASISIGALNWSCRASPDGDGTCDCGADGLGHHDQTVIGDALYHGAPGVDDLLLTGAVSLFVATFQMGICDCPIDPTQLRVIATVEAFGLPSIGSDPVSFTFVSTVNIDQSDNSATCDQTVYRCGDDGRPRAGALFIPQTFTPSGYGPWIDSPGIITITPTCHDCEDKLTDTTGDKASICAYELDVVVDIADGPGGSFRTHVYKLFGGPESWGGVDQFGLSGGCIDAVENLDDPTFKCCGVLNRQSCADCDANYTNPDSCPGCWLLTLTSAADGPALQYFGTGACPSGFIRIGDMTVDAGGVSAGFPGGCQAISCNHCAEINPVESLTVTIGGVDFGGCGYPCIQNLLHGVGLGYDFCWDNSSYNWYGQSYEIASGVNGTFTLPLDVPHDVALCQYSDVIGTMLVTSYCGGPTSGDCHEQPDNGVFAQNSSGQTPTYTTDVHLDVSVGGSFIGARIWTGDGRIDLTTQDLNSANPFNSNIVATDSTCTAASGTFTNGHGPTLTEFDNTCIGGTIDIIFNKP